MRQTLKKLLTSMLAIACVITMTVVPASTSKAATVTGDSTSVKFNQYLILDKATAIPSLEISYSIAAGTAVDGTKGTAGNAKIYEGIGTPTISSLATFAGTDTALTATDDFLTAKDSTLFDTTSTKQVIKKEIGVNFSSVSFTKPGIYRYVISQNTSSNTDIEKLTEAITCDVYVVTDGAATENYSISKYVLHTGATTLKNGNTPNATEKTVGFANELATYTLELSNKVTGNQGDRTKDFTYEITITGDTNETYKLTKDSTEQTITSGTKAEIIVKHGEKAVITGISKSDKILIAEKDTDVTVDGYDVKYTINSGTAVEELGMTTAEAMGTADKTIAFENRKNVVTPTGIALTIAPYAAMVAVAAAVIVVFRKKKAEEEEE